MAAAVTVRCRPTAGTMEMPELKTKLVVPTGPVGATAWQTQMLRPRRCRFWMRRNPRCKIQASRFLSFHAGGQPRIHQRGETASGLNAEAPTRPRQAVPPVRKAMCAPSAVHCSAARTQYWAEVASGGRASHCGLLAPRWGIMKAPRGIGAAHIAVRSATAIRIRQVASLG